MSVLPFGCFQKYGKKTQIINFNRVFHYKPSILGGFSPIFGNIHLDPFMVYGSLWCVMTVSVIERYLNFTWCGIDV